MEEKFKFMDDNNIEKEATVLLKTNMDGRNYVIYYVEDNSDNVNICAARCNLKSDGSYDMVNLDETDNKEKIKKLIDELAKGDN